MTRKIKIIAALAAGTMLAGCMNIPDYRGGFGSPGRVSPAQPSAPLGTAATPQASAAESACTEAGRAAGFDVQGVVGTHEVIGTGGLPQSRDVMLRVARGGQSIEVRCSYAYVDGSANIMTL
ncbi:hypothetical protein [Pararhodobacter oceanensis]|uniref:hypothetical protein n=1 Tax=Pararhodobacter oceanensis TaxID=2172121 RepID=UPI003A918DA0